MEDGTVQCFLDMPLDNSLALQNVIPSWFYKWPFTRPFHHSTKLVVNGPHGKAFEIRGHQLIAILLSRKTFSLIGENVVCNAMTMNKLFFKSTNGDAGINFTGKEEKSASIIVKTNNCPLMMEGS